MAAKLDYHWHLRRVMADRGMFSTTDLLPPLAAAVGGSAPDAEGLGGLRPKRPRIRGVDRS
ncbi:hypothetical protein OG453_28510 [Streptomyces sp. NBC_01381]|uniref:hypothetical protein n=1 Tax=Streptomyces sp. NBC_01381 TaxID=2903845 RepID=UPI0022583BF0|nr:hypothetical protein [Streptomyces sp. NBC_01381]MCX4670588.1 hypothetical protein [Streptomyces sp. NBC_01381]